MLSGADFCPESIASGGICTERASSFPFLEKLFLFEALNMGEFEKKSRFRAVRVHIFAHDIIDGA